MVKSIKLKTFFEIVNPEYTYLQIVPNNSIRNNQTYRLARTIAGLYKNITQMIRKDQASLIKMFGREFLVGTKYSFETACKVSYYIYIEKSEVNFYFIVPERYKSIIKERMTDVWGNVTINEIESIPQFSKNAIKYQLVYDKGDALSLNVDRRSNELISSNINVIDVLEEGDKVGLFYNFIPTSQFTWRGKYKNTIDKVKNKQPVDQNKTSFAYSAKLILSIVNSITDMVLGAFVSHNENNVESGLGVLLSQVNGQNISQATVKKENATVLGTQIVILSESKDKLRERNNARSLAQSFEVVTEDNRLSAKMLKSEVNLLDHKLHGVKENLVSDEECQNFISLPGREILENFNCISRVETHETMVPEDLRKGIIRIGYSTFRGKEQMAYLSSDKEYKNLTLVIIGPTRAGKTTYIGNLSKDTLDNGECTILFDFIENCELSAEVSRLFPPDKVLIIDCKDPSKLQGIGYNEVGFSTDTFKQYDNAKKQTTQLLTLINSVNSQAFLTAKMERYFVSASLIVFISNGSVKDVFGVLQNHKIRKEFVDKVPATQHQNMEEYLHSISELDEHNKTGSVIGTKYHLIDGIIDRMNKLNANTYLEMMLKKGTNDNIDLSKEIQKNQLICLKMPESMFATDSERDIYTTYWITKLWLALQVRSERIQDRHARTKVNLIIDELYQVKNTERFLTEKLSRLAKFGLKPVISCHYLNQIKLIRDELRSANTSYMLISGCDKKNYDELRDELYPFELRDLLNLKRFHSLNLIKSKDGYSKFITKLPPPISQM